MDLIHIILYGLATWRISSMFVDELGPFNIFLSIRSLVGIMPDPITGSPIGIPEKFLPKLLSCVWCFSVWVGIFFALLRYFFFPLSIYISLPFALSAIAIAIDTYLSDR